MPINESGHAVNVANLLTLTTRCNGFNTPTVRYNPTNTLITITVMQGVHTSAVAALANVQTSKAPFIVRTNERHPLFKEMELLSTRVVNALDATQNVDDELVDDAKTFLRKIRGERKGKKILNPNPNDPQQISVSQQSYTQQLEHFNGLVALVAGITAYNPNETELQVTTLQTFATSLTTANANVVTAQTPYLTALQDRNNVLYTPVTGLIPRAQEAKKYIKSVKAILPPEKRTVTSIKFRYPS